MPGAKQCPDCYGTGCTEPDMDECETCGGEGIVYRDDHPELFGEQD